MKLPIINCNWKKDVNRAFIDYWSTVYQAVKTNNHYYDRLIQKTRYTPADIQRLFDWKNGMPINSHKKKSASVDRVVRNLALVNQLKRRFERGTFDNRFGKMSPIWQIFLLHLIDPKQFPIFDQHVYRAQVYITGRKIIAELPLSPRQKLDHYHKVYKPFFEAVRAPLMPARSVDNALWAFGRFLKTEYAAKILLP